MTLTPEEKEMIEREAEELVTLTTEPILYNTPALKKIVDSLIMGLYKEVATKYLTQLKSERERAGKLLDALEGLMKGVAGLPPLTAIAGVLEQQYLAGEIAITEYKNNNQSSPSEK